MSGQPGEPSLEDILASIKKVISEDNRLDRAARLAGGRRSTPRAEEPEDILELTEDMADAPPPRDEDALVDANREDAMRASLEALAALSQPAARPQIVRSGETSLEEMVREMLKPMLKQWLDDNLPAMVDAMVAREIARITGKQDR